MKAAMGTFFQPIILLSEGGASETVDALVDTGSTFSSAPRQVLERLGVRPHRTVRLRLANGQVDERQIGRVMAQIDGVQEEILCVFGGPNDVPTIGAHTLQAMLLGVDPDRERLVPVEGWWV
jgi:predicted aspartyl protease